MNILSLNQAGTLRVEVTDSTFVLHDIELTIINKEVMKDYLKFYGLMSSIGFVKDKIGTSLKHGDTCIALTESQEELLVSFIRDNLQAQE